LGLPHHKTYATVAKGSQKSDGRRRGDGLKTKQVLLGGREDTNVGVVKKIRTRGIFVSRLDPKLKREELLVHLRTVNKTETPIINCFRLQTKYSTYSSFYVEVEASRFEELFKADIWPSGCLVTEYRGRPRENQIVGALQNTKPLGCSVSMVSTQ